jgi:hypothetical protein
MKAKDKTPKIVCHETKKGIKCKYEGPVYTRPKKEKQPKPSQTYTM